MFTQGTNRQMAKMNNRRLKIERRSTDTELYCSLKKNRRIRPDRRLNNIKVEWIPIRHISIHPATRLVFSR